MKTFKDKKTHFSPFFILNSTQYLLSRKNRSPSFMASAWISAALRAGLLGTSVLSRTSKGTHEKLGSTSLSNYAVRNPDLQLTFPSKRRSSAVATSADSGPKSHSYVGCLDAKTKDRLPQEVYGMVGTRLIMQPVLS
jgi:hypothetical protein